MVRVLDVRFAPFGNLRLSNPPSAVRNLLERRWMVEVGTGSTGSTTSETKFELDWRLAEGNVSFSETDRVQWQPQPDPGRLGNTAGTIEPSSRRSARVCYLPGAIADPLRFEPFVEAALALAWATQGVHFVHGCAFELAGRSVIALGESGCGKSTLACAVVAAGGRIVSDDSLLIGRDEGEVVVRAARRHVWLRPGSERLVSILESRGTVLQPATDGRLRLDRDRYPQLFTQASKPDALVVLAAPETSQPFPRFFDLTPLTLADTLATLVSSTSALYLTDARFGAVGDSPLAGMTEFAEALPGSRLQLSKVLLERPEESLAALVANLPYPAGLLE